MHVKHEIEQLNPDAILYLKGMFESWEPEDGAQFRLKVVSSDVKNLARLAAFVQGETVQEVMPKMSYFIIELQAIATEDLLAFFAHFRRPDLSKFIFRMSQAEDLGAWTSFVKKLPSIGVQLPENIIINLSCARISMFQVKLIERHILSSDVYPGSLSIIYRNEEGKRNRMIARDVREYAPPLTDIEKMLYQAPAPSFMRKQPAAVSSEDLNQHLFDSLQKYTNTVQSPKAEEEGSEVSLSDVPMASLLNTKNTKPIQRRPRHEHVRSRDRTWSLGSIEEGDEEVDREDDSHSNTQSEDTQLKIG